jgi:RHS repeat-associated protein
MHQDFQLLLRRGAAMMVFLAGMLALAGTPKVTESAYYRLSFQGRSDNTNLSLGGGFNAFMTDETGELVSSGGGGSNMVTVGAAATARVLPGKTYTITISGAMVQNGSVTFTMPRGQEGYLHVDGQAVGRYGIASYTISFSSPTDQFTQTHTISVHLPGDYPLASAPSDLRGGEASALVSDKPIWYVGLGRGRDGGSAGAVGFRAPDFSSANFFTPRQLVWSAIDSGENQIVFGSDGSLRQAYSREVLIDVVSDPTANSYRLNVYSRSQVTGATLDHILTTSGSPFVTYLIYKLPGNNLGVGIDRTEDGVTWTTDLTQTNLTWKWHDWHLKAGSADSYTTTAFATTTTASFDLYGPASGLLGDTALGWDKVFTDYGWGKELTGIEQGAAGDSPLVTQYSYYDDPVPAAGYRSALKWVIYPSGNWEKYDYYTAADDVKLGGLTKRIYRPWKDGPTSPDLATAANAVCEDYTYTLNIESPSPLLVSKVVTAMGTMMEKTAWAYDYTTANLNGRKTYTITENVCTDSVTSGGITTENYLTTVKKMYRPSNIWTYYDDKAVSIVYPDGRKEGYAYYNGSWDASTRVFTPSASGDDRLILVLHGQAQTDTGAVSVSSWTQGSTASSFDSLYLVPNRSTVTETVVDTTGRTVFVAENVCTSATTMERLSGTIYRFDTHGRKIAEVDIMRSLSSGEFKTTWDYAASAATDASFTITETSPEGVVTKLEYDELQRLKTKTIGVGGPSTYPARVGQTSYDAANRPVASYGCSCQTSPTRYHYDAAGRIDHTYAPGPNATDLDTKVEYPTSRKVTTTLPSGATKVVETYLDGRTKSITGTAQPPVFYDYAATSIGLQVLTYAGTSATAKANGWSVDQYDYAGRIVLHSVPSYGWSSSASTKIVDTISTYNAAGQLSAVETSYRDDGRVLTPPTLYAYGKAGQLTQSGLDVNRNGVLDKGANDRIQDYAQSYAKSGSAWTSVETATVYAQSNSATGTLVQKTVTSLTGFAAGTSSKRVTTDAAGHDITTVVTVDPANKAVRTTVTAEAIGNAAYTETRNGYDALMQDTSGARVQRTYDTSGRLQYVNSRWNGSSYLATDSYEYSGVTDFVTKMTVAGVPAQYGYAWGSTSSPGRTVTTTDADSKVSYVLYNAMELPFHLGGAAASATAFGYDSRGRQTTMTTWRSGASYDESNWPASGGDTTTWTLDPATGLLTQKKDAAGKTVDYTYTELGQVATRTWARYLSGSTTDRVKATYDYYSSGGASTDVSYLTGELKGISYNDSLTPSVAFTYNRAGLLAGATDGVTGTHVFAYNPTNPSQLASETLAAFYGSRVQTRKYDTYGRATGFTLGTSAAPAADLSQIGTYHATTGLLDHLDTASGGGAATTVQYGYESSSSLVDNYAIGSFSLSYDYDATSAARRSRIEGKFSTVTKTRFDLTYDSRGNLRTSKQSGTAFADYYPGAYSSVYNYHLYDERGQLKTSAMYGGTPPVSGAPASASFPGRRYEYRYDQAGNRTTVGQTGTDSDDQYATNSLNQYTTKENNDVHVLGTAAAGARVAMANATVAKVDRSFAADVAPGNADGPKAGSLSVYSAVANPTPGGPDVVASQTKSWMVAKQLQAFTYDLDGNMTGDGVWTYAYDAENRLISMARTPAAVTAGLPDVRLEFKYDYMGRRVQKRSVLMAGTTVTQNVYTRYLYDGWNLVAEFAVTLATDGTPTATGVLQRSYTWGLDVAGSTTATGGVGALVRIVDHTGTADAVYFPTYDGSGNVSALVAADGSLAAVYEYTAFGELQRAEGAYAAQNPFGFSTKFTDRESGLSYYGYRYYSPALGRFINRDPIAEQGGLNLYGFVGNNPTTRFDVLGMRYIMKCNNTHGNALTHTTCWWEDEDGHGADHSTDGPKITLTDNKGNILEIYVPGATDAQMNQLAEDQSNVIRDASNDSGLNSTFTQKTQYGQNNVVTYGGLGMAEGGVTTLDPFVVNGNDAQNNPAIMAGAVVSGGPSGWPEVPDSIPDGPWKWSPNGQNSRNGVGIPEVKPTGRNPNLTYSEDGKYWKYNDGKGNTQRFLQDGTKIGPNQKPGSQPDTPWWAPLIQIPQDILLPILIMPPGYEKRFQQPVLDGQPDLT